MDQMKEGMGNLTVPLPEEAVGVGAKWEMKKTTKVQTTSVEQAAVYDLASVEGDRASVKFTQDSNISQKAQAGTTKVNGSANGTITLDLAKLAGPSFTLDTHMESPMGNNNTMKMDMNMSIEAH